MPDKSALVYGGRSPIALELCQQLALNGYTVHLVSRTIDETINKLAKDNGCLIVHKCDLEDSTESVKFALRLDDEVKGLRAVAFVHRYRGDASNSLKQFSVEVDTPYQILKGLAARTRTDECSVLVTTSPAAHSVVGDQDFQYHASKAALSQLVKFGAVKFASQKMRVNGLSPGSFIFKQRAADYYSKNPKILERANDLIPLSRMGSVAEVASVGMFLLSEKSSYLNGQIIEVDGGLSTLDPASLSKPR